MEVLASWDGGQQQTGEFFRHFQHDIVATSPLDRFPPPCFGLLVKWREQRRGIAVCKYESYVLNPVDRACQSDGLLIRGQRLGGASPIHPISILNGQNERLGGRWR